MKNKQIFEKGLKTEIKLFIISQSTLYCTVFIHIYTVQILFNGFRIYNK